MPDGGTTTRAIGRSTAAASDEAAGRTLVLAAVCLAGLAMPLSFTGPTVALPAIGRDLGAGPVALSWVLNGFILAFGSTVMAAGTLADRFGRKRLFTIGMALFTGLSLVLGLSPDILVLDLLRAALGVAAALAMAGGAASLAHTFEGSARTRAYSLLGTSFGVGLAFGPVWQGYLVEALGWRASFASGAVIGILVLLFGVPRMAESRDPDSARLDWAGTLTFTAALAFLTFGVVEGPQRGWADPLVVALLILAPATLALFVLVERAQRRPMLDLSLFAYPRFIGVQSLPIATAYGFVVPLILLPARFIGVEGMSEVEVGIMMMPLCLPIAIVPFLAALMTRWVSAGTLSALGLAISAVGLFWLASVPPGSGAAAFIPPLLVIGVGSGLPWGLMDSLAVSVVPKERAGMATGIFATMRVAGEAVAIAVIGAVLLAVTQAGLSGVVDGGRQAVATLANALVSAGAEEAAGLAPGLGADRLLEIYTAAFRTTLTVQAAITLLSAFIAFATLRRREDGPLATEECCRA